MLELLGGRVLKPLLRDDIGVVRDHVDVRHAPNVVTVVNDSNLVVAEVPARLGGCELTERVQSHMILGIRREHVVFVGRQGPPPQGVSFRQRMRVSSIAAAQLKAAPSRSGASRFR